MNENKIYKIITQVLIKTETFRTVKQKYFKSGELHSVSSKKQANRIIQKICRSKEKTKQI